MPVLAPESINLAPESLKIDTPTIFTGATATGTSLSGASLKDAPAIDYSTYKYYSGSFLYNGISYGNGLYSDDLGLPQSNIPNVQIYSYNDYQKLNTPKTKTLSAKTFSTQSTQGAQVFSISSTGLIGKWDLNGSPADSSGNGNNAVASNMTWPNDSSLTVQNSVGNFNGTNSYLDAGDPYVSGGSYIISGWIKSTVPATSGDYNIIYRYSDSAGYDTSRVYFGGYGTNALYWKFITGNNADANNTFVISKTFNSNQWYHVIFELDNVDKKARFYLDGSLYAQQAFTGEVSKSNLSGPHKLYF